MVQHIQNYHEYYAKDENWKNFVLHNKGPEAWEQDKAEREMVLTEFIPYLKQHCNLSAMGGSGKLYWPWLSSGRQSCT